MRKGCVKFLIFNTFKHHKQSKAWCCAMCKGFVFCMVSCVVLNKIDKQGLGVMFGVLCGFPVKKSIFVKTKTSRAVAGCGHFRVRDKV
jgi:hypothetical protein